MTSRVYAHMRRSMITEERVLECLREECERLGSQKAFADLHGLSTAYINDVLRGRRELGPAILAALDVERVVTYRERQKA